MAASKEHLRKIASSGGIKRAEKLPRERRIEIARLGGLAGGNGRGKKNV